MLLAREGENGGVTTAITAGAEAVDSTRSAGHTITPRRGLPNGRALVGALLVTIGALGAFALATGGADGPATSYLVATRNLEAGAAITLDDVRFEPMELSPELAATTLNSTDGLEGAVLLTDLRVGELLDLADVIAAAEAGPDGLGDVHEITFGVPLDRTPADLAPGDRVTVLATHDGVTRLAVEDAPVLAIDTQAERIGSSGRGILTLAIDDPIVVMEIAHLTQVAEITIVRSTRALDDVFPATATTPGAES